LRFHTIIWPAILIALDLPLPKLVFANGWITMEGRKISKSVGNIIRPSELIERYTVDGVRYVLFAQAPFGVDFSLGEESLVRRYNAELANDFGNLVQRVLSMLARYRQGKVPAKTAGDELNVEFEVAVRATRDALTQVDFRGALTLIWDRVTSLNLYVEQSKPWAIAKDGDDALLDETLYNLCEGVRLCAGLIYPFMPNTAETIWDALGQTGTPGDPWEKSLRWGGLEPGTPTTVPPALFPRIEDETPVA
jgi:methionyl-tRNA synthetase